MQVTNQAVQFTKYSRTKYSYLPDFVAFLYYIKGAEFELNIIKGIYIDFVKTPTCYLLTKSFQLLSHSFNSFFEIHWSYQLFHARVRGREELFHHSKKILHKIKDLLNILRKIYYSLSYPVVSLDCQVSHPSNCIFQDVITNL
jgi:hypothetical protein